MPPRLARYRVTKLRKKDPDDADVGFALVTILDPRPDDEHVQAVVYNSWLSMQSELDQDLTSG